MRKSTARRLEYALLGVGAALTGYCALVAVEARVFEIRQSRRLERAAKPSPSSIHPVRPHRWAPGAHEVIGKIEAPRINLSAILLEGDDSRSLRLGAGHIPGTALPGEAGNLGIAAHRDTFFRPLRHISPNDEIDLITADRKYRYLVTSTEIVSPGAVSVLRSKGRPELTLVTCYPFYYIGPAPQRFVVHARLAG